MTSKRATIGDYLQLMRLSNVFTALADVAMGFLFVQGNLQPVAVFVCLAVASMLLYVAGMVLNDVWDVEQDRRERPTRPIASGRIDLGQARRVGFGLLLSGVVFGWAAGYLPLVEVAFPWRSGVVVTLLALLIVLYDALLKRTLFGPLAMGGCRALNVLLGMSAATLAPQAELVVGFGSAHLFAAGGIGLYIVGVTWFARSEAAASQRWQLAGATTVMASGVALLGLIYQALPADQPRTLQLESSWFLLLGLLAFVIVRRCVTAVSDPSPQRVQLAVKNAIWSLIMLDAAIALLISDPIWAVAIVTLLVPTMLLGRRIAST